MDDTKAPAKTLAGARRAVLQRLNGLPARSAISTTDALY